MLVLEGMAVAAPGLNDFRASSVIHSTLALSWIPTVFLNDSLLLHKVRSPLS